MFLCLWNNVILNTCHLRRWGGGGGGVYKPRLMSPSDLGISSLK